MKNLKVSLKLILSYVIVLVLMIIIIVVSIMGLRQAGSELERIYNEAFSSVQMVDAINLNSQKAAKDMLFSILNDDENITKERLDMAADELKQVKSNVDVLMAAFSNNGLDELKTIVAEIEGVYSQFSEYALGNANDKAWELYQNEIVDRLTKMNDLIAELSGGIDTYAVGIYEGGQSTARKSMVISTSIGIVSIIIAISISVYLIRIFTTAIDQVKEAANKIAKGDFNVSITYQSKDEFGQLADIMRNLCSNTNDIIDDLGMILGGMENGNLTTKSRNADMYIGGYEKLILSIRSFRNKITDTLSKINEGADQVLDGSEHVSSGAQGLSQGTTEQASSVQELSATINEVNKKVSENAESAKQAMRRTEEAGSEMRMATEKMDELLKAMEDTKQCSDEIGKIIKSIEDIAFQTNILALNAAVEAARAGTAGKGFAVVADEVRNLAAKSAEAASNTNTLIENTISSVEHGNELVKEVADMMNTVSDASGQVAVLNTNISEASTELAEAVNQITSGIDQISSVVQTNAATAEQSAAASEELSGQAHSLKSLVDEFVLR